MIQVKASQACQVGAEAQSRNDKGGYFPAQGGKKYAKKKKKGHNSIKTGTEMTINRTKSLNKYLQMAKIS